MHVDLPLDKKTGKSGLGQQASGLLGPRTARLLQAEGHGPSGRWAVGLLLAKPLGI